jgi:hypothetical protein
MADSATAETDTDQTVDNLRGAAENWVTGSLGDYGAPEGPKPEAAEKKSSRADQPSPEPDPEQALEKQPPDQETEELQDKDKEQVKEEVKTPEDEDEKLPEAVQRSIDKRIGKEVAKRKELESRLAELTQKLSGQEGPRAAAAAASADPELDKLAQEEQQAQSVAGYAKQLLRRSRGDLEGVVAELKSAKVHLGDYSEEQVTEYLENVRDAALEAASKAGVRRELTAAQREQERAALTEAYKAQAVEAYPELGNPESAEAQAAARILEHRPWLKGEPAAMLMIGDMLAGHRARMGQPAAAAAKAAPSKAALSAPKAAPAKAPPKLPAAPSAAPPPPAASSASAAAARERFFENPESEENRIALFKQLVT